MDRLKINEFFSESFVDLGSQSKNRAMVACQAVRVGLTMEQTKIVRGTGYGANLGNLYEGQFMTEKKVLKKCLPFKERQINNIQAKGWRQGDNDA